MSDLDDILDRVYDEHQPPEADAPAMVVRCKRCGENDLIWSRLSRAQRYELTNRMGRKHTCKVVHVGGLPVVPSYSCPCGLTSAGCRESACGERKQRHLHAVKVGA